MKLSLILVAVLLISSCQTERQLQVQKGRAEFYHGHVKFIPLTKWEKLVTLPDTVFKIRNATVRKVKQ